MMRMGSYTLRDTDPILWKRIKTKAASESISLKALIEKLLRDWAKR